MDTGYNSQFKQYFNMCLHGIYVHNRNEAIFVIGYVMSSINVIASKLCYEYFKYNAKVVSNLA